MTDLLEKSAAATEVVEAVCAKRNDAEHDSVPMAPEKNWDVECLGIPTLLLSNKRYFGARSICEYCRCFLPYTFVVILTEVCLR